MSNDVSKIDETPNFSATLTKFRFMELKKQSKSKTENDKKSARNARRNGVVTQVDDSFVPSDPSRDNAVGEIITDDDVVLEAIENDVFKTTYNNDEEEISTTSSQNFAKNANFTTPTDTNAERMPDESGSTDDGARAHDKSFGPIDITPSSSYTNENGNGDEVVNATNTNKQNHCEDHSSSSSSETDESSPTVRSASSYFEMEYGSDVATDENTTSIARRDKYLHNRSKYLENDEETPDNSDIYSEKTGGTETIMSEFSTAASDDGRDGKNSVDISVKQKQKDNRPVHLKIALAIGFVYVILSFLIVAYASKKTFESDMVEYCKKWEIPRTAANGDDNDDDDVLSATMFLKKRSKKMFNSQKPPNGRVLSICNQPGNNETVDCGFDHNDDIFFIRYDKSRHTISLFDLTLLKHASPYDTEDVRRVVDHSKSMFVYKEQLNAEEVFLQVRKDVVSYVNTTYESKIAKYIKIRGDSSNDTVKTALACLKYFFDPIWISRL